MWQRKALLGSHWPIEMSSSIPLPVVLPCLGSVGTSESVPCSPKHSGCDTGNVFGIQTVCPEGGSSAWLSLFLLWRKRWNVLFFYPFVLWEGGQCTKFHGLAFHLKCSRNIFSWDLQSPCTFDHFWFPNSEWRWKKIGEVNKNFLLQVSCKLDTDFLVTFVMERSRCLNNKSNKTWFCLRAFP